MQLLKRICTAKRAIAGADLAFLQGGGVTQVTSQASQNETHTPGINDSMVVY